MTLWIHDPAGTQLQQQLDELDEDAPLSSGLLTMGDDGICRFLTMNPQEEQLSQLAAWVRTHPTLAILKNAQIQHISEDGTVLVIHANPNLWDGVPDVPAMGNIAHAAQVVDEEPEIFGVLLVEGKPPRLFVTPDLNVYSRLRNSLSVRFRKQLIQGICDGDQLQVTRPETWASTLSSLIAENPQYPSLTRLLQNSQSALEDASQSGPDYQSQSEILSTITQENGVYFWFAEQDGEANLWLNPDRNQISALAAGTQAIARGQVYRSPQGWLDFRSRVEVPTFLPKLISWVATHADRWPALKGLVGARVTARDATGKIFAGYRDDEAWRTALES